MNNTPQTPDPQPVVIQLCRYKGEANKDVYVVTYTIGSKRIRPQENFFYGTDAYQRAKDFQIGLATILTASEYTVTDQLTLDYYSLKKIKNV